MHSFFPCRPAFMAHSLTYVVSLSTLSHNDPCRFFHLIRGLFVIIIVISSSHESVRAVIHSVQWRILEGREADIVLAKGPGLSC